MFTTNHNLIKSVSYFSEKFGLYHVDFTSPKKTRTPKVSAKVYANIAKTHAVDWKYRPKPTFTVASFDHQLSSSAATVTSSLVVLAAVLFATVSSFC